MKTPPIAKDIVKFNSHSQARDKIYRIVQYGSRLVLWYLARQAGGGSVEEKLKKLEAALALSRKLFRMGNSLELGQKALEALWMPDPVLQKLAVTAHTLKALWLLLDHTIWCGKVQIVTIDVARWSKWSSWAWLVGLSASTAFDLVKLHRMQTQLDAILLHMDAAGRSDQAERLQGEMHSMRLTFWRDVCDLFIPLSALNFANPGLGALCGLASSLIGFQLEWEKHIKPYKSR